MSHLKKYEKISISFQFWDEIHLPKSNKTELQRRYAITNPALGCYRLRPTMVLILDGNLDIGNRHGTYIRW